MGTCNETGRSWVLGRKRFSSSLAVHGMNLKKKKDKVLFISACGCSYSVFLVLFLDAYLCWIWINSRTLYTKYLEEELVPAQKQCSILSRHRLK